MAVMEPRSDPLHWPSPPSCPASAPGQLPPWRSEGVARASTKLLARLLALVAVVMAALLGLAVLPSPIMDMWRGAGAPAVLVAVLTPALAGLAGAAIVSRARSGTARAAALVGLAPGVGRPETERIGWAARLGQIIGVAGAAAAGLAAAWQFLEPAGPALTLETAGITCLGLSVLAYPLLIGERVLANTPSSNLPEAPELRALLLLAVVGVPVTGVLLLLDALGTPHVRLALGLMAGVGALVSSELLVRAVLRAFLPAPDADGARAACRSLVATLLEDGARPGGIGGSIRRNLGIDFARSWALSFVRAALPPIALGLAALSWGLTGLVVVGPDQRAIVERLGRPVAVLRPGLHLAAPWPVTRIRLLDNGTTRETNLAGDGAVPPGRRARAEDRDVPEADRLWQDAHASERLFLIASATDEVQSFQAMGADIRLIWRVGASNADAMRFAYSTVDPERLLVAIAGRAMAEAFASQTLETVLGENRAVLAADLARVIQDGADQAELGIALVAVVIEAMHPPRGAASAFHAVQAAALAARAAVAAERGNAVAVGAQAQTTALQTRAAAVAAAAETRAAATVRATGFEADRESAQVGGRTFMFERYLANLVAVAGRTSLTVLDHRVVAPQAPTIDLRLPGGSGSNGP